MNKTQVKGRARSVTGRVKQVAGKAVGNKDLESRGKREREKGRAQAYFADIKKDIADLEDDIKKAL